jgi:nitrate reductase gamma subunit
MNSSTLALIIAAVVFLSIATLMVTYQFIILSRDQAKSKKNIQEIEKVVKEKPHEIKTSWDLARITLQEHFKKNLDQISFIFWISIFVTIFGFLVILIGIILSSQSSSSFQAALLVSSAGILTEFIGATFLYIYKSTIDQALNYARILEKLNRIGIAIEIAQSKDHNDEKINRLTELLKVMLSEYQVKTPEKS